MSWGSPEIIAPADDHSKPPSLEWLATGGFDWAGARHYKGSPNRYKPRNRLSSTRGACHSGADRRLSALSLDRDSVSGARNLGKIGKRSLSTHRLLGRADSTVNVVA